MDRIKHLKILRLWWLVLSRGKGDIGIIEGIDGNGRSIGAVEYESRGMDSMYWGGVLVTGEC